jgi:DNA-binding NarL/FixJ family response regulator
MHPQTPKNLSPRCRECLQILIVEDNVVLARTLAGTIKRFGGHATPVGTVREGLDKLGAINHWAGVILDLCLPDGPGVRVLESMRETDDRGQEVPVLVLTAFPDHPAVSAAYDLRAQFLEKPATLAQIEQFIRVAEAAERRRTEAVSLAEHCPSLWRNLVLSVVERLADEYHLSPVEREILVGSLCGQDRASMVAARNISPNTLKTQIRHLLLKTGETSLGHLRDRVLQSLVDAP